MEILHRHGPGLCYKCPTRDVCVSLCSKAEAYAGQDEVIPKSDVLGRKMVEFNEKNHSADLGILYFNPNPVVEAIQSLPIKELVVIVLKYYGGLKPNKIGEVLCVSRQRVNVILKKAEKALIQML